MFPFLYLDVVRAISDRIDFNFVRIMMQNATEYTTYIMSKFRCMHACPTNVWVSKKVAILISGYAENGYSTEAFNQRCKTCNQLGDVTLDKKSYVD